MIVFIIMLGNQQGEYSPNKEARWDVVLNLVPKLVKIQKKIRILDVACGDASLYKFISLSARYDGFDMSDIEYFGVDKDRSMQLLINDSRVNFYSADVMECPKLFGLNSFDIVVASEIIEHLVDTDSFVGMLRDQVKEEGFVYLTTPNLSSWHARLMLLFGLQPLATEVSCVRGDFGNGKLIARLYNGGDNHAIYHVRAFTLKALKEFLIYHGFKIVSVSGGGYKNIDNIIFNNRFTVSLSPVIKLLLQKARKS